MRRMGICLFGVVIGALASQGAVVINEVFYNPPDVGLEDGSRREFIELYNSSAQSVDLSQTQFIDGVAFTIPSGTQITANGYLLIVRDPTHSRWRNQRVLGPYVGKLDNSRDTLVLAGSDGREIARMKYGDRAPWPQSPDGYGSSLERIHWNLPSEDYHTWRGSLIEEGTPGRANSVVGTPPKPMLPRYEILPEHPKSSDSVTVKVSLEEPALIQSANLLWEAVGGAQSNVSSLIKQSDDWQYWKGTQPPSTGLEWTRVNFVDSQWLRGAGGFGYGDLAQVKTNLTDMRGNYTTVYIRKKFTVDQPAGYGKLGLNIYYDDGFICYINGKKVASALASEPYDYNSTSIANHESDTVSAYELGDAQTLLQAGENVIALVGFNTSKSDSTDFVLAASLTAGNQGNRLPMERISQGEDYGIYQGVIPPVLSQTLVRSRVEVKLITGETLMLPHEAEPRPFLSYFVYDEEIQTELPLLWVLKPVASSLLSAGRTIGGAVSLATGTVEPSVYDGALVYDAHTGIKVKFIKGEEFWGDRTINITPEAPTGGTNAGVSSPFREYLGYWFFKEMNILSPWAEFYRIAQLPATRSSIHEQRLVVEQVNEKFLERNGRNPDGDLYKRVYTNPSWEKHTHKDEGIASIQALEKAVQTTSASARKKAMVEQLDYEEFLQYSVASILTSNWDGLWNNHWMYLSPETNSRWEIVPWDFDWLWGSTTEGLYAEMPLTFPLDGVATGGTQASRPPGPIISHIHKDNEFHQEYIKRMRREMTRRFAQDVLFKKIEENQALLFRDLKLFEQQSGIQRSSRYSRIESSWNEIKSFITKRHQYLDRVLPVPVEEWREY